MARVTSFVMMVFMIVPAVAPSMGQVVIHFFGWRGIFMAYVAFAVIGCTWLYVRQEETLVPEKRRPLAVGSLLAAAREVLTDRNVLIYTAVMTLGFGQMFALLSSIQQLFTDTYGKGAHFPQWFALIAVFSASASMVNAKLVMRIGMRAVCLRAYALQAVFSLAALALVESGLVTGVAAFVLFFAWATSIFFMAGLTFGNLNALSLQRMGHIAGMAASIVASVATVGAVAIAAPVGLAFNGTAAPVMAGAAIASGLAWLLMRQSSKPGLTG
jgi:DHA1 family bicyclomycin/chloramphenicol resistance-like MFS transporter